MGQSKFRERSPPQFNKASATLPAKPRPVKREPATPPAAPPFPPRDLSALLFPLTVGLVFFLLLFRRPDSLLNPQFWAEDGSIFFKDQLLVGLSHSLFYGYMGYLHFVPRLVASFASWFPVAHAPFLYNLWATGLAAAALSLFALPAYRFLIRPDYLRIAVCAISAGVFCAPEVLGTITNIQWYLSIGVLVLLFYPVPQQWAASLKFQLITGTAGLILACTSPQVLIFLPLILWKLHPFDRRRSLGTLMVITGLLIQILVIVTYHAPGAAAKSKSLWQMISVTLATPVYRCVMSVFLGDKESMPIAAGASLAMNVGSIVVFLCWLVWLFRICTGPARWSVPVAAYAIFASVAVVTARRPFGDQFDLTAPWTDWGAGRYTLLGSVLIVYLAALTLEQIAGRKGALVSTGCLLGLFAYGLHDHYSVPTFSELDWPNQARQIQAWVDARDVHGLPAGLLLHLNPTPHWTMYLPARLSAATPDSRWEGCLVRGQGIFQPTSAVYWIGQGKKLHVSPDWVTSHGLRWDDDVRIVPEEDLDAVSEAR